MGAICKSCLRFDCPTLTMPEKIPMMTTPREEWSERNTVRLDAFSACRTACDALDWRVVARTEIPDLLKRAESAEAELANLKAENARLREAQRWVPVGEALPTDLLDKLVVDATGYVGFGRSGLPYGSGKWTLPQDSFVLQPITHWRELPDAPEDQP